MLRGSLEHRNLATQFIFSLLIILGTWIIFQVFSLVTGLMFFDVSMKEATRPFEMLDNPEMVKFLKYIQTISSIGLFGIPSLIIAYTISSSTRHFLEMDYFPSWSVVVLSSLLMVFSLPLNNFLSWLNMQLQLPEFINGLQVYFDKKEEQGIQLMNAFLDNPTTIGLLVNLFVVAVVPAFAEEFLFRGIIQKFFIRWTRNVHWGVIITGFIFGLAHFQFLSALPRIIQGIMLGYIFYWTRSIWIPVIAHLVNNAMAVFYYHYYYKGMIGEEVENIGMPETGIYYVLVSTVIVVFILVAIRGRMKEVQPIST